MAAIADTEKELMVRLWAATLRRMPATAYNTSDAAKLEASCACGYDGYMAALAGDFEKLRRFVRRAALDRSDVKAGDVLRALWAFRDVAAECSWGIARLYTLDAVIRRATVAFAELCEDLRTEHGYLSVLRSIALDAKDKYTSSHCQAVQRAAEIIAADLGVDIGFAGLFHDLGKIHVPDRILQKPGDLTPAEYEVVKQHSAHAYRILAPLPAPLRSMVLRHHERPDGRGYPLGLTTVPMPSAVVAVADTLHAIVSERPYRAARPFEEAVEIINQIKGTQLRSEPVDAFNRVKDSLRDVDLVA